MIPRLIFVILVVCLGSNVVAQDSITEAACKSYPNLCLAEVLPNAAPDQATSFEFTDKSRASAPMRPALSPTPLANPDVEITFSEAYLEATIKTLLTERLALGEPQATNFLLCADKERIQFHMGSPSEPNEYGPLELVLQRDNCTFGFGNVCHNCGLKHFYFYLYPVYQPGAVGSGTIDFYLWPGWILLTSPPGGRELPFWISALVMKGMWERYFVPRWDQPSDFRKPVFSIKLEDSLVVDTTLTILGQTRPLLLKPVETALLFYRAEPYGGKNGRMVFQAKY